ncbi:pyridoxamine 5'-phosphate oxidase family protein [Spongisporangium articulatum]|uniref:Pyridoxamine 5'-phosphate oxidase family protein n=1 Tax=Spongisporangium articulatum TaxID=3362603 RepID=A0ABW8ATA7_9ACTN
MTRLDGDLWALLVEWLPANAHENRPRMTVSTVTAEGRPDARTLLLSEFDPDGFYFHTDARSRKVAQLKANPGVALSLLLDDPGGNPVGRQLVVQGVAEPAPAAEERRAYAARSPYLQQLAWQNTPEFAQLSLDERLARWAAFGAEHARGFTPPPTWVGYLVRPTRLTFWQGNPDTASRRTEFRPTSDGWQLTYLPG